jgi:hypothetical protein
MLSSRYTAWRNLIRPLAGTDEGERWIWRLAADRVKADGAARNEP